MDPNPKSFPILSYVLDRLPSIGPKRTNDMEEIDLESPPPRPPGMSDPSSSSSACPSTTVEIVEQMPFLARPKVISSMTRAIDDVSQTRSILRTLGPRPDHESVDAAKAKMAGIEDKLSKQLEEIVLSQRPPDVDRLQFRSHLAEKENECRKAAQKEKAPYRAIVQLDEMHDAYEKLLADAEKRLVKIYESAEASEEASEEWEDVPVNDEVNDKAVEVLHEASGQGMEHVNLSGRKLRFLPEAFGKINGLVVLNVSNNQLEIMPDSIAGLGNLVELNCSSNLLEALPDSIGLLENLKILNASGNKLTALPDPICQCRSLVELDASFNKIAYLPTNLGYGLVNLEKLIVQLNKIRSLPSSIGEMRSLRHLDAHFNELRVLPVAIGKLASLETLNLSSNFSDLQELPDSIGDLMNLRELDVSNNQIRALPDTFGRLDKLVKLNLEHNPLEMPPPEIVKFGVEAIKVFMAKRWLDILLEEELKSTTLDVDNEDPQNGWLTRSTSWIGTVASGVSGYLSSGSPRDRYLDQQL